jgi:DNA polymerase-1
VFDGKGGSTNKRYLYPEYKANRGISRVTNWDNFESQDEESEAITNQILRLVHYLRCLPVDLISIDKIEADDVIGYMAGQLNNEVTIVSSDRDYLQLVSDKVQVYSPIKKKFYTPDMVLQEYGVTPTNFLIQKVVLGDSGDNVPGVKGIGEKTLVKLYPELGDNKAVSLDEIVAKAEQGEGKKYAGIRTFKHQLYINEQLMDLTNPNIPEESLHEIHNLLDNPYKQFSAKDFMSLYEEDGLGESIRNLQSWLYTNFNELQKYR